MESVTISKRMKHQQSLSSIGNDLIIFILLRHFRIRNRNQKNYIKFCECEKKRPLDDFVEYILTKMPDSMFKINYNSVNYKYYIYENNVFFSKDGEKLGAFIGNF
jgi:hypothetical protein